MSWFELDWEAPNVAVLIFNVGAIAAISMAIACFFDRLYSRTLVGFVLAIAFLMLVAFCGASIIALE